MFGVAWWVGFAVGSNSVGDFGVGAEFEALAASVITGAVGGYSFNDFVGKLLENDVSRSLAI